MSPLATRQELQMPSETLSSHDHQVGAAIAIAERLLNAVGKPFTASVRTEILADINVLHRQVEAIEPTA